MLVEFRLKNFKSYRDEQTFSLVAGTGKELPENLVEADILGKGTRLVKSAVIYGANASGKSNLFEALYFMRDFILTSSNRPPGSEIGIQPFLLDKESKHEPIELELTFTVENVPYRYGFSVNRHRVLSEWLVAYPNRLPQVWYERELPENTAETPWYFGPNLKGEKNKLKELTRPDVLFLSVAAQFNHEQLLPIYDWFRTVLTIISSKIPWGHLEQTYIKDLLKSKTLKEKVVDLVRTADVGIENFEIKENYQELKKLASLENYDISFHQTGNDDSEPIYFSLENQSLGTRRMLTIAVPILNALETGSIFVMDEIDSSLHPILVKEIVTLFNNPEVNLKNAQLVFNTHDVSLLDNKLLRRDQIWFTEKSQDGSTYLYSLQEFKPRKSEALEKNYMQGRYGAIPIVAGISQELMSDG